ncbi:MAG TPA: 3-deoxy-7-phosphoheptulonate synthase [Mogibacterium sp.]|nr:3-deoxy-7-phosphoheptulonate synthase [Mogibacterium sp.]
MEEIRYRQVLLSSRETQKENSIIDISGKRIGDGGLTIIAGPCSVESENQIFSIAEAVKKAGADFLRGGAYKPRTSPYDFQGLEAEGVRLLLEVRKTLDIPIVSEIVDASNLDLFEDVDILQVGSRNMQNFTLLKALGRTKKPVLLKRGYAATYREVLTSAEYILSEGNSNVIICERGIRTFETYTRNTLDIAAVPAIRELSHLPIAVDPSHGSGRSEFVEDLSLAAVAAGADALMIEVHNHPEDAFSDGKQSITPGEFEILVKKAKAVKEVI